MKDGRLDAYNEVDYQAGEIKLLMCKNVELLNFLKVSKTHSSDPKLSNN